MHVFVTGGAGFVGSNLIAQLCAQGHRVTALDNFSGGDIARKRAQHLIAKHAITFDERDVHDIQASLAALQSKPDAIVHLAGPISVPESIENPEKYRTGIAEATARVSDAALASGVKRLVFASTAAVYGNPECMPISEETPVDPQTPYAQEKYNAEQLLRAASTHGLETAILRFFNIYGPGQDPRSIYSGVVSRFMERVAQGLPPMIYGTGMQTRDLVHVHDVNAGIIAALQRNIPSGLTANIGSGKGTSINDVARILLQLSGSTQSPAYLAERTGDIFHSRADIRKAAETLGYAPTVALEAGLRSTWDWYLSTRQE